MDHVPPTTGVPAPIHTQLPHTRARKEPRVCTDECGGARDCPSRNRGLRRPPDQASQHNALGHHRERSARPRISTKIPVPHAPARRPEHRHICRRLGTTGLTPAARGAALALRPDETGQLRQHHLTGTTIFGASSHGVLKTLAMIVEPVIAISKLQQSQPHQV